MDEKCDSSGQTKINPFDDFPAKQSPRTKWHSPWYKGYDIDKWREIWEQIIIDALNNSSSTTKTEEPKMDYMKCYLPTQCENLSRGMYCPDECKIEECSRDE